MGEPWLMQGDCLERMKEIPDGAVDMVLCDPPYGIDFQSMRVKNPAKRWNKVLNDKAPFLSFIPCVKRLLKSNGCVFVFTRWDVQQAFIDAMTRAGLEPNSVIIWDKKAHGMGDLKRAFARRYESILFHAEKEFRFQGKRPVDLIATPKVSASKQHHPNEKPVELLEKLIVTCCKPGGGSAGLLHGQRFYGRGLREHRTAVYRH